MNLEEITFQTKPFYQLVEEGNDISQVFSEKYKAYFSQRFPDDWRQMPISTILRRYGNNFVNDLGSRLKILQLGCGPNYGYNSGPELDQTLTNLGAEVINLDIEKRAKEYYSKGSFIHGSCLELDKYFSQGEFDVIFMDSMDPDLDEQIREIGSNEYLSEKYLIFVNQVMDKLRGNGMFFISNASDCCFRITDSNLREIKKEYKYTFFNNTSQLGIEIGFGLQVYEKAQ